MFYNKIIETWLIIFTKMSLPEYQKTEESIMIKAIFSVPWFVLDILWKSKILR